MNMFMLKRCLYVQSLSFVFVTVDTVSEVIHVTGKSVSRWLIHVLSLMRVCVCVSLCMYLCENTGRNNSSVRAM